MASVLRQILDPFFGALTPEGAQRLMGLQLDETTLARIEHLRAGANEGTLSVDERAEYLQFVEAVDLLEVLQAKARQSQSRPSGT